MRTRSATVLAAASIACLLATGAAAQVARAPVGETAARPSAAAAESSFLARNPDCRVMRQGDQVARVYGPLATGATPIASAESFLRAHAALFGIDAADLAPIGPFEGGEHLVQIMDDEATGMAKFTGVYWTQQVRGVPVFRSHLLVLTRNEPGFPAVLASSTLWDVGEFAKTLEGKDLTRLPDARIWTRRPFNAFRSQPTTTPAQYVVWAGVDRKQAAEPRLAVQFEAEGGGPWDPENHQRILFVVDAADGTILYQESRIYHAVGGQITGQATVGNDADTCAGVAPYALPYVGVVAGGVTVYADANGNFTHPGIAGTASYVSTLGGRFFTVQNNGGAPLQLSQSVADGGSWSPQFNATNALATDRSQVNAYRHANIIRDLTLSVSPNYPTVSTQGTSFIINNNIASTCNAYYSASTINFYAAGGGCANTGFGTVVHHEYGHNLVEKGGSGQGAYGEGMGDICGLLVADDPRTGIGFQTCSTGIRNASNTCQYSATACSSCGSAIHACGQLISGCVWDLRNYLLAAYPGSYRTRLANYAINSILLHGAISTIADDIVVDFLVLDDDDGNVNNGTPNYQGIAGAFGAHGLNAPPLQLLSFVFPQGIPSVALPTGTTTLAVNVVAVNGVPASGSGKLYVKAGTATTYTEYAMTETAPNSYTVRLPAGTCGTSASWYVGATTTAGQAQTSPVGAPASASYSSIYAGSTADIANETFETAPTGWVVGAAGDAATTGIWVRGDPLGTAAQPENDRTPAPGVNCWFTGQGTAGGAVGEADIDGGATTLVSATYNCTGYDHVFVSYSRWYSNNTGSNPATNTMPVEVSFNNGTTWVALETVSENTGAWVDKTFRLNDFGTPTAQVRFRWVARDLTGAVVEAALDDFRILGVGCAVANPADLNGDGIVNGADLGILLANWGTAGPGDLNGDGSVTGADLGILLGSWG